MKYQQIKESLLIRISIVGEFLQKNVETLRYFFTPKKNRLLLNFWAPLNNNKVNNINLGDDLNFYIIRKLTNKSIFNLQNIFCQNQENIMVIGSIIEHLTTKNSIIWGSGAMYGGNFQMREFPQKVLAVRGPLSRDYLLSQGVDCPEVYGDPALLLPIIYTPKISKKYKLGIIPHYVDFESEYISKFKNEADVKIIRLRGYTNWKEVIDEICSCEFVVSSSLHGLIISDAYKIPNQWVKFSDKISGGYFKYHDYFLSVGREINPPYIFTHATTLNEILEQKGLYKVITWDPTKLLQVSPFRLKESVSLSRSRANS